jgi:hypothetical protein
MVQWGQFKEVKRMRQGTLAGGTFETYRKPTHRERFLAEMDKAVPWQERVRGERAVYAALAPHDQAQKPGRSPSARLDLPNTRTQGPSPLMVCDYVV